MFHFHLPAGLHVLHVGGRRYPLEAHTAATRDRARRMRRGLAHLYDEHLTHFAGDVWVSTRGVQRIHVTTLDPERGPGLALVAMHIASTARRRARRARNVTTRQDPIGADCDFKDQVEDDYLTGRSTAKAIITHHPDLCNLDADVAAAIETRMDGDQAAAVDNLALSICDQGPAYEHDPAYLDGWCVLVPLLEDDGTPRRDTAGEPMYDYQFSEQTETDLKPAVAALLEAIKNDPTLNGQQYTVIYHGDPVDEAALPPAQPSIVTDPTQAVTIGAAAAVPGRRPLGGASASVTFTNHGYHHNVLFYDVSGDADRNFSMNILNLNSLWYSLYLEYLDGDGQPIATSSRSSWLSEATPPGLDLETDTLKFWDIVSPPATFFGIPVPVPYRIAMEDVPPGASQIRLSLIGPGSYGQVPYGPALIPGIALTVLLSLALPTYFMVRGAGLDETESLLDLFTQKSIIVKSVLTLSQAISAEMGTQTNELGVAGSLASLLTSLVKNAAVMGIKSSVPELWDWLTAKLAEEEAEEAVPFSGWVIRIMALLGTGAELATTIAEATTNPIVISNTVAFTHTVKFIVHHDPDDFEFPLTATRFIVQVTVSGRALGMAPIPIRDEERSQDTLTVEFPDVPLTYAGATVQILFLTDSDYPIAHSAAVDINGEPVLDENGRPVAGDVSFFNGVPDSGGELVVDVPIVENPFPITQQTLYVHHHKLEYADGRYHWNYTSVPPALEPASCGPSSGLCELGNVTVWVPGGMIGYSWRASSPSIHDCRTGATGQLYTFQNLSLTDDPNPARKTPGCGFPGPAPLAYDAAVRVGEPGRHFYLDPVSVSDDDPVYHLRRLTLDTITPIDVHTSESWGRFRIQIDRLAVHAKGDRPVVVGISTRHHKFAVLEIPPAPYLDDTFANNAKVMAGPGESHDGLILNPAALTIADSGAILILQGGALKRVKAFDFDGKPWKFFAQGTSSVLSLAQDSETVTWLDLSIDPTNLLYVLSFTGAGLQRSDYRLDVYDANTGEHVLRNTGIAVGRIVVDKFRGLYSLNSETVKGSPIVEPSVSVWAPTMPSTARPAHVTLAGLVAAVEACPHRRGSSSPCSPRWSACGRRCRAATTAGSSGIWTSS